MTEYRKVNGVLVQVNANKFKRGDKVTVDNQYEGVIVEVKSYGYDVRIFDGSRIVGVVAKSDDELKARE